MWSFGTSPTGNTTFKLGQRQTTHTYRHTRALTHSLTSQIEDSLGPNLGYFWHQWRHQLMTYGPGVVRSYACYQLWWAGVAKKLTRWGWNGLQQVLARSDVVWMTFSPYMVDLWVVAATLNPSFKKKQKMWATFGKNSLCYLGCPTHAQTHEHAKL